MTVAPPTGDRQFITLARAAERHDCSVKHLRKAIAAGELPAYRLGRRSNTRAIRVELGELDAWMRPIPTAEAGRA
jgi:excisionase family DNA binding protein